MRHLKERKEMEELKERVLETENKLKEQENIISKCKYLYPPHP